jgi:hypothetical protein
VPLETQAQHLLRLTAAVGQPHGKLLPDPNLALALA